MHEHPLENTFFGPPLDLKVVLHTLVFSIGTCLQPSRPSLMRYTTPNYHRGPYIILTNIVDLVHFTLNDLHYYYINRPMPPVTPL